jgi:hypothetical protein
MSLDVFAPRSMEELADVGLSVDYRREASELTYPPGWGLLPRLLSGGVQEVRFERVAVG